MNVLDIAVIAVIGIFAVMGFFRGLVKTCFSLVPGVVSIIIANRIYPTFSKFLRTTPLYGIIENGIGNALGINSVSSEVAADEFINGLSIPEFLKESLIENNNPVIYDILKATGVGDYISGYIASIFINIISMIVVTLFIVIIFKLVLMMLDIVTKLPVIHSFNSAGGFVFGLCQGVLIVWIVFVLAVFFCSADKMAWFYAMLQNSTVALFVFNNNILLMMILKIFA